MSEDKVITALSEDRVREIVREEFAPLLAGVNDMRDEIKRVDADRRESANLDANERQDLRKQVSTILDIVNANAVAVQANRDNIFTVQTSTKQMIDELRYSALDRDAAIVSLTGQVRNAGDRVDSAISRVEWHDTEAAETRKIAEKALAEANHVATNINDVLLRMTTVNNTVNNTLSAVKLFRGELATVREDFQPMVEFAKAQKARMDQWRERRGMLMAAAKSRPGMAALAGLGGLVAGVGVVELVDFVMGVFLGF